MMLARVMELVSQAEREGVTLAAMMSKEMSSGEMELVQRDLIARLNDNYSKIERFMAEVTVPSMDQILADRDGILPDLDNNVVSALSDEEG
jgi:hypothetical protein